MLLCKNGPSAVAFADNKDISDLNLIFFLFPSLLITSKTADNLPPYSALNPPLVKFASFIASTIKFEKIPQDEKGYKQ